MIGLLLDVLRLTERRLVRRLIWSALAVLVPVLLLAGAIVWASVAAFLTLSQTMAPHYAALVVTGGSFAGALLIAAMPRLRRRRPRRDDRFERLVAELLTRERGQGDIPADLAAILVLAEDLMSRHGRRTTGADG